MREKSGPKNMASATSKYQSTPLRPPATGQGGRDMVSSVGRLPRTQQHGFGVVKKRRSARPKAVEGRLTDATVSFTRCLGLAWFYCTLLCTFLSAMRRGSGGEGPAAVTVRQGGPILRRVAGLAGPGVLRASRGPSRGLWDSHRDRFQQRTISFTSCHARQHSTFSVFK